MTGSIYEYMYNITDLNTCVGLLTVKENNIIV
jgi:hypothetical protein